MTKVGGIIVSEKLKATKIRYFAWREKVCAPRLFVIKLKASNAIVFLAHLLIRFVPY
jgi:hypothetical protein